MQGSLGDAAAAETAAHSLNLEITALAEIGLHRHIVGMMGLTHTHLRDQPCGFVQAIMPGGDLQAVLM